MNSSNSITSNDGANKQHLCPLESWCDKCAFCEFDYDKLKRKIERDYAKNDQKGLNILLEEKLKASKLKYESKILLYSLVLF